MPPGLPRRRHAGNRPRPWIRRSEIAKKLTRFPHPDVEISPPCSSSPAKMRRITGSMPGMSRATAWRCHLRMKASDSVISNGSPARMGNPGSRLQRNLQGAPSRRTVLYYRSQKEQICWPDTWGWQPQNPGQSVQDLFPPLNALYGGRNYRASAQLRFKGAMVTTDFFGLCISGERNRTAAAAVFISCGCCMRLSMAVPVRNCFNPRSIISQSATTSYRCAA